MICQRISYEGRDNTMIKQRKLTRTVCSATSSSKASRQGPGPISRPGFLTSCTLCDQSDPPRDMEPGISLRCPRPLNQWRILSAGPSQPLTRSDRTSNIPKRQPSPFEEERGRHEGVGGGSHCLSFKVTELCFSTYHTKETCGLTCSG
jgi:hypothetical protein